MKSLKIESISDNYDFDKPIKGFAILEIGGSQSITIKTFTIKFYGEYSTYFTRNEEHHEIRMKRHPTTKEMIKETVIVRKEINVPKTTKFYKPPSQQVSSAKTSNGYVELTPGIHRFPVAYQIEQEQLPSTTLFPNPYYSLKYFILCEVVDVNEKRISSKLYQVPLCYRSEPINYIPLKTTKRYSDDSCSFELNLNTWRPSCGNVVSVNMRYKNKQLSSAEISMFIKTYIYSESRISHLNDTEYCEETEPLLIGTVGSRDTQDLSICYEIPVTIQSVVYNSEFNVFHQLVIRQKKMFSSPKDVSFDIDINCTIPDKKVQRERMKLYTINNGEMTSRISQKFQPPKYVTLVDSQLHPGIEKIIPFDEEMKPYYVNHFNRSTSYSPNSNEVCEKKYPFYESLLLPPGWSVGKTNGQRFFIDHNSQTTTWDDPRCDEEFVLPHSHVDDESLFSIEILETKNFVKNGLFSDHFYASIMNEKKKWISSKLFTDGIQNEKKRKILSTRLSSERMNIILHFFKYQFMRKDIFSGEINFDLMYIPPNTVIEDWFDIKESRNNHRKDSNEIIGKVLLRICYKIGKNHDCDKIVVDGYDPLVIIK